MDIRPEQMGDEAAIRKLTIDAFEPMEFSNGSESAIIDRLRRDGDLTVSLVAVDGERIVGHIAFSPVTINDRNDGWFGLGPVSVCPERQKQGIGRQLIKQGLATIEGNGATGCALIGDPNYYSKFGFQSDGKLEYGDVPTQYVQWLSFGTQSAFGKLKYAPAFELALH